MEDLIRRSDAIKIATELVEDALKDSMPLSVKTGADYLYVNVVCPIRNIPAVEPRRGEWITIWDSDNYRSTQGKCNCCGRVSDRPLGDFCKWCGARMKGAV
jgi:hypothetical protein